MRCAATVQSPWVFAYRARTDCTSPQCRREAKVDGLCRQHAAVRYCAMKGCDQRATKQVGVYWFCRLHAPQYAEHTRVVNRILEIPPR